MAWILWETFVLSWPLLVWPLLALLQSKSQCSVMIFLEVFSKQGVSKAQWWDGVFPFLETLNKVWSTNEVDHEIVGNCLVNE